MIFKGLVLEHTIFKNFWKVLCWFSTYPFVCSVKITGP